MLTAPTYQKRTSHLITKQRKDRPKNLLNDHSHLPPLTQARNQMKFLAECLQRWSSITDRMTELQNLEACASQTPIRTRSLRWRFEGKSCKSSRPWKLTWERQIKQRLLPRSSAVSLEIHHASLRKTDYNARTISDYRIKEISTNLSVGWQKFILEY